MISGQFSCPVNVVSINKLILIKKAKYGGSGPRAAMMSVVRPSLFDISALAPLSIKAYVCTGLLASRPCFLDHPAYGDLHVHLSTRRLDCMLISLKSYSITAVQPFNVWRSTLALPCINAFRTSTSPLKEAFMNANQPRLSSRSTLAPWGISVNHCYHQCSLS